MTAFLALVHKDLLLFLQDRRALLLSLLAPILIAAFFGSLFGGSAGGSRKTAPLPIAVSDLDGSALSQRVLAALEAEPALAVRRVPADEARALVLQGKLRAAVLLPPGLGQQAGPALFGAGAAPEIRLIHDPSQGAALALLRGLLTQQLMQQVSQDALSPQGGTWTTLRQQVEQGGGGAQRADLLALFDSVERVQAPRAGASAAAPAGGLSTPFALRTEEALPDQNRYNAYAHAFGGMGVQFILMMGIDLGVGLLLLRRSDLWKRLRVAPLTRVHLLGSRLASTALIAFVLFALILLAGGLVFGVRVLGSWMGLLLILASFGLLTASFGLLIAAIGRTPEATRGLAIMATLLLVMVGGAWVPAFLFPAWLQDLSLFIPTRWAVDGIDAMTWRGLGWSEALPVVGVLLGFSTLFGGLALWRFRWEP